MKNKIKILLLILSLCIVTVLSTLIVIAFTNEDKSITHYEYVDLYNANISYFNMDSDFYTCVFDGYNESIGVDLSEFNGDVNFIKLKEQGIEYAYLRIGWRGYITPDIHVDKRFEEYYEKAKDAGIDIGIYFFSQAINETEAIEEANFVINMLKDKPINTYIAFDFETIEDKHARTNNLTRIERTKIAKAFLDTISNANYKPMLYTNYDWILHHYTASILQEYPVWYAQYSKKPQYKGHHLIWQYATNVKIDGISSNEGVDLNIMLKKEETN